MAHGHIYKITSPTGRIYVGLSADVVDRAYRYSTHRCKRQPRLYASIKKHGWKAHTFEVIDTVYTPELLPAFEIYWINKLNTFTEFKIN